MIKIDKNVETPITKKDGLLAMSQLKVGESISIKRDPLTVRIWVRDFINFAKMEFIMRSHDDLKECVCNEMKNIYGLPLNAAHRKWEFVIRREGDRTRIWRKK